MKSRGIIKRWYEGEYVPPDKQPDSTLIFVTGHYKRHWSSCIIHTIAEFYLKEWKWLLPFIVALVGVTIAVAKLWLH